MITRMTIPVRADTTVNIKTLCKISENSFIDLKTGISTKKKEGIALSPEMMIERHPL